MRNVIRIGTSHRNGAVNVTLELRDTPKGKELSICGEIWQSDKRDIEMGGQCLDHLAAEIRTYSNGWNLEKLAKLVDIWRRWHLNGMRTECEHQRARGETWETHPSEECPDCGYKLGHAWLFEPLPQEVIEYVQSIAS
jgi:hypothetical protein